MVPDPNTDDAQPIIALNVSTGTTTLPMILVGGVRSYVGGVAQLPYSYSQGDRRLDLFDFSRGGWPSLPSTVVAKSGSITTYTSNCSISTGCSYLYGYVQLASYPGSTVTLSVNSRKNIPLFINVTVGTGGFFSTTSGPLSSLTTMPPPISPTTRSTRSAPISIPLCRPRPRPRPTSPRSRSTARSPTTPVRASSPTTTLPVPPARPTGSARRRARVSSSLSSTSPSTPTLAITRCATRAPACAASSARASASASR
jgi:hypothetical protein